MKGFKKTLCVVLALVMMLGVCSIGAFAATEAVYTYTVTDKDGASLDSTKVDITATPDVANEGSATVDGLTVTFTDNSKAYTVKIATKDGKQSKTLSYDGSTTALDATKAESVTLEAVGEDKSISSSGAIEGYIDPDIIEVTLPTVTALDYTVDPQALAYKSSGGRYKTDEDTTVTIDGDSNVLFLTSSVTEGGKTAKTYSNFSQPMTATNNGNGGVAISVKAVVTGDSQDGSDKTKAQLATSDDFTSASQTASPRLYLALTKGKTDTTPTALVNGTTGVTATATLDGISINDFDWEWKAGTGGSGKYEGKVKDGIEAPTVTYYLTGKADAAGKWTSAVTLPSVSVVWSATPNGTLNTEVATVVNAAPKITDSSTSYTWDGSAESVTVNISLGKGELAATNISSVYQGNAADSLKNLTNDNGQWSFDKDTGVLLINKVHMTNIENNKAKYYEVTMNDGASTVLKFSITRTEA